MDKYTVYIVLTRTNTVISKLIQFFKDDEYTHAAISLDRHLNYMYSFGRKWTYYPFYGCFKHENLEQGAYKFCDRLPGVIMEVEVSKEQYEKINELLNQFINNSNYYRYNYIGLLNSLFNREACYDNRFLCSEFVYYILYKSGVLDLKISGNLIRPQDFLNLEYKIIYEGDLKAIKYLSYDNTESCFELLSEKMNVS